MRALGLLIAAAALLLSAYPSSAAGIRVEASAPKVTPGDTFGVDIVVENIPPEGLGAVQFRLNISAPGSTVAAVSDTFEGRPADVSVSSPLTLGPPTTSRSGISDFFWNAKSSHGVLVMDNETLQNGSGLYTLGHTNGALFPSGSGAIARFQIGTGREVAAEKIVISLSDVVLLDGRTVYPLDSNTAATVDLKCYTQSPNLIGMSRGAAETALSNAKLALGSIYEIDNSAGTHALNTVLVQSSNPGATILCDTPIDVAINTAPSEVGNISALDRAGDESGVAVLAWLPSSSSDAAGYRVYNAAGDRLTEIANAASTGVELSGLPVGQASQIRVTAFDTHGNESAGSVVAATPLDDVAPRIAVSGVTDNTYYAADVQPVITVQDLNPAAQTITLNGTPYAQLPISAEGNYLLKVSATDSSGNSTVKEISFTIDKTAPVISVTGIAKNAYYNRDLNPAISVTDANLDGFESFLNGSAYTSGAPVTAENNYQLVIQAVDKAGNRSSETYPFFIDKTNPTSSLTVGTPKFENGPLYVAGGTPFMLAGNDTGAVSSGVDKLEYRANGASWSAYQAPVTLGGLNDGTVTMDYRAVDLASNIEDFQSFSVTLDTIAPVTALTLGQPKYIDAAGATYVTLTTTFTLSASDASSGVAATQYKLDGAGWSAADPFSLASEGAHTILYRSSDNVANSEADKFFTAIVDNTPPVTTINTGDPKYTAAAGQLYVTGASTFTLSATDSLSGVAVTEYRIDGGSWIAYAPFTVAAEGTHTIDFHSKDNVANAETFKTITVIVDNTPPVTTIAAGDPKYTAADGKLYVTAGTTFTLSATDSLSGVAVTEYRLDGGSWIAYAPFTVAAEGTHTIDFRSRDNVANAESIKTITVIVDTTPPVTTIAAGDPKYTAADGKLYVTGGSTFTLSATDNLSGVAATEYRLDGGSWMAYAPFIVPAEGTHTIDFQSRDNVANAEPFKTITVIVDNTPPVTTIAAGDPRYTAADGKLYVTGASSFTLSATDSLSGVAATEYRIDGGSWIAYAPFTIAAEGTHTIDFSSKDNVANAEPFKTITVIVDNTPPVTTLHTGDPKYAAADGKLYVTGASTFTLSAADSLSGVAVTEYRLDGGSWTTYAPFTIAAEGSHLIEYRSTDNVRNTETPGSRTVIVDNTPPVTIISTGDPKYTDADGKLFVSGSAVFTMSATDNLSGLARTEYLVDNGQWTAYAPFTVSAEGTHTVGYRSQDNVANLEIFKSLTVVVDNTAPVTTIITGNPKYAAADGKLYVTSAAPFTLSATDNLSGVAKTEYRIDNGAWTAFAPFTIAAEGTHTIDYRSQDNVTNLEAFKTLTVIVDNTPPVTVITTGDPKYSAVDGRLYVTAGTPFTLSATDNLSGVAVTEYRIDGGGWTVYAPFTISVEGTHSIEYRSKDNVQNTELARTQAAIVDNTPPVSTLTVGSPQYQADGKLYISGGTGITITATDPASGVKKTEYSIDNGQWTTYTGMFMLSVHTDGNHTIRYRSQDNVDNREASREIVVVLDKTPPQTAISGSDPLMDGVMNTVSPSTYFTLTAADSLSGVKSILYRIDRGAWQPYTGSFSLAGTKAGQYAIGFKSIDNVLNEETEKTISVSLVIIEVEKKIAAESIVLVGFESDKSDADQKQADIQKLTSLLASLNLSYAVTSSMEEFATALRSGRYNTYVLIDAKEPLIGEEVREAVHSGDALIFIKTRPDADPFLDDVFGVNFKGKTTSDNLTVNLQSGPISAEAALQTIGKSVVSAVTATSAQVLGTVADKQDTYPAIIFNQYDRGKVLLYTFDLLNTSDQALASALLVESLNFVRPGEGTPRPLKDMPIRITVRNSTEPVDVKVTEIIPAGATTDTVVPTAAAADGTLTWQKSLAGNETARFGYYLNLPDIAGDYRAKTELTYSNNGLFRLYGNYEILVSVENSSDDMLQKIVIDLDAMLQGKTGAAADLIAKAIDSVLQVTRSASTRKEIESNIRYIVTAIDAVRMLPVDAASIRRDLGELLKFWEKKWYLAELPR
jgi:hypothetical protein